MFAAEREEALWGQLLSPHAAGAAHEALHPDTIEIINRYLREGGPLSIGDGGGVIKLLEGRLADILGVRNVLTCNSGTSALHSAYLALDLPPGSEVAVAVTSFHAAVTPALQCGLSTVVVDVDPHTGNLCPDALREAIGDRTRAVAVTHTYGHPAEMAEITQICRTHQLRLVEDCSHAYLSTYRDQPVGTFGDVAVWSMQWYKSLSAGEGGFLATPKRALFERACLAGHYRGRSQQQITDPFLRQFADTGLGLKYRLHPLAALIALGEAEHLAKRVEQRTRLLRRLSARLQEVAVVRPPLVREHVTMGGWFGYRPTLHTSGTHDIDAERYVAAVQARGVPVRRPSIGSLDGMALFTQPVPLRHAARTWQPRLCGPFTGARAYEDGRLSVTVTSADDLARMDAYAVAFADAAAPSADQTTGTEA